MTPPFRVSGWAAAAVWVVAAGCGYTLVGTGAGALSEDIRTVAVLPLTGRLPRVEIVQRMTQSIVEAFVARTNRKVITEKQGADAVLKGKVQQFQVTPIGWDQQNQVNRFQVTIVMELEFKKTGEEKALYTTSGWTFRTQFDLETSATDQYTDRELLALDSIGEEFGRAVVSAILEGF